MNAHYNSSKPSELQAYAYTQGTEIYIGPSQEKHLPHEAWHVVQQKEGRVEPTLQLKGTMLNDNSTLEQEAELMGMKALQQKKEKPKMYDKSSNPTAVSFRLNEQ